MDRRNQQRVEVGGGDKVRMDRIISRCMYEIVYVGISSTPEWTAVGIIVIRFWR